MRKIAIGFSALALAPAAHGATLEVLPDELSANGGRASITAALTLPRRAGIRLVTWSGTPIGWVSPPATRRLVRVTWHGRLNGARVRDGYYHLQLVYEKHVLAMAPLRLDSTPPRLSGFRVTNGGSPFAGDRRLLATISPNGDGFRDSARIDFRLSEPGRVVLQLATTGARWHPVAMLSQTFSAGRHSLVWEPGPRIEPRTYPTRLTAVDTAGNRTAYGPRTALATAVATTPVVRVQGVDAGFTADSYAPGETARLVVSTDAPSLSLQYFRSGPEAGSRHPNGVLRGRPVSAPIELSWRDRVNAPSGLNAEIPDLPTGFYFARLLAPDGRAGYAPFVVRPAQPGIHRIAVVLPTNTWQAYNFRDEDGNGWGDTWYAGRPNTTVRLGRPYLNYGIPPNFRAYDLGFLHWLAWWHDEVDYLADSDFAHISTGEELARRYDLVVFPGHEEYVSDHEYDVVQRYRDLGGNLMFLSADNFYWRIVRKGQLLRRTVPWRTLGRPEAALIGVQYRGGDGGGKQRAFVVVNFSAAPWAFANTGLFEGSSFGLFGIEIDSRARASPPGTKVLAILPDIYGPGFTAHMTYYETAAGAKVFAAGALGFAGSAVIRPERELLDNLWNRLRNP